MANNSFTIRIFVPGGNPEGARLIDRMNWTGLGIVVPRDSAVRVHVMADCHIVRRVPLEVR